MNALAGLKFTAAKKATNLSPVVQRRNKLLKRIWEQIELAKAEQNGEVFSVTRLRSYKDSESGIRKQIETQKRVKAWWFTGDNGKLALSVRYGARILELAKGKYAVEVGTAQDLVPTLETIKAAVDAGELDNAIELAANTLKNGFAK